MNGLNRRALLGAVAAAGLVPALRAADPPKGVAQPVQPLNITITAADPAKGVAQPVQPLNITVTTAAPTPDVSLVRRVRTGKVTPVRSGSTHTGGGNIDVQQPAADTLVVTMTGVAVAYGGPCGGASASQVFELVQQIDLSFDKPTVKAAKLTIEGRLMGLLRSDKVGSADVSASATLTGGTTTGLALTMPEHAVSGCENLSINDKESPDGVIVAAGRYTLSQSFRVTAAMPKAALPCKAPSAEFAPDPALDPLWISTREPFKGANKKDLGFQVIIRVAPEEIPEKK